jgi:hypothetical protein
MKTIIKLESSHYQVRNKDGKRQVRIGKNWIPAEEFPEWLADQGKWAELAELVFYGIKKLSPEF